MTIPETYRARLEFIKSEFGEGAHSLVFSLLKAFGEAQLAMMGQRISADEVDQLIAFSLVQDLRQGLFEIVTDESYPQFAYRDGNDSRITLFEEVELVESDCSLLPIFEYTDGYGEWVNLRPSPLLVPLVLLVSELHSQYVSIAPDIPLVQRDELESGLLTEDKQYPVESIMIHLVEAAANTYASYTFDD